MLHCRAEQPYVIDVAAEAPERRAACVHDDGLDRALVAISSPIGIEALPRDEAEELLDAHLEGVLALPDEFAAWGPVALDRPDPDDIDAVLARGCVGVSLPAGALAGPDRLERAAGRCSSASPVAGVPLFVHPGRAPGQHYLPTAFGEPLWWRALDRLRRPDAGRLADVRDARAPRAPRPQGRVRDARRRRAAAQRAAREPGRAGGRAARPEHVLRDLELRPGSGRDDGSPCRAEPSCCTAPTGPVVEPAATDDDDAMRRNAAALFRAGGDGMSLDDRPARAVRRPSSRPTRTGGATTSTTTLTAAPTS